MTAANPLDTLSPTRKADRPKMAALIADAMRAAGAIVTVEPCGWEHYEREGWTWHGPTLAATPVGED